MGIIMTIFPLLELLVIAFGIALLYALMYTALLALRKYLNS
ncbi:hypothetical protein [Dictyobacter kobayashii]|nr:hypothetical protein [Dictyobacter kobayashii]